MRIDSDIAGQLNEVAKSEGDNDTIGAEAILGSKLIEAIKDSKVVPKEDVLTKQPGDFAPL